MYVNTKRTGNISEAKVLAKFVEQGWSVLSPFGDIEPYDLVIDRGFGFEKVQVKTAWKPTDSKGSVCFNTTSIVSKAGGRQVRKTYEGLIDLFAVYNPELDEVYVIPVNDVKSSQPRLRIDEPLNNQVKGIMWAKMYLLP